MILPLLTAYTGACLNSTITNSTNPATLLNLLNQSPCLAGPHSSAIGLAITFMVLAIFTISMSFRIKIIDALLGGAFFAMITSLLCTTIGILYSGYVMLFIGLMLVCTLLATMNHVLHIFD
jgi:hypothetical protein